MDKKIVSITIRCSERDKELAEQLAGREERSISFMVRRYIRADARRKHLLCVTSQDKRTA